MGSDRGELGRALSFVDVTERERYRRELERQNERLDAFAAAVSHDLRNPLTVAMGRVDLALDALGGERSDPGGGEGTGADAGSNGDGADGADTPGNDAEVDVAAAAGHLGAAATALDRMETLIENVLALARTGQPVSDPEPVSLADLATECWAMVGTGDADLTVDEDVTVAADPDRLRRLLENLFRNTIEHGEADTVTVGGLADGAGFYVADDGPGIPEADREQVFELGHTTAAEGTGFGLAIVAEVAEAHGWSVAVTDSDSGGARFEVRTDSGGDGESTGESTGESDGDAESGSRTRD